MAYDPSSSSTSTHLPNLAPQGDIKHATSPQEVLLNFTDAQVEEFREQDRFLPVCLCPSVSPSSLMNWDGYGYIESEADDRLRMWLG
jgi:hypothetical protein